MNDTEGKKLVYFDFVTHFGGSQLCTALLCEQLQKTESVKVLDAYGVCEKYLDAIQKRHVPIHILLPEAKRVFVGHKGKILKRIVGVVRQLPEWLELRRQLIKKVIEINPDLIWTNSSKALLFLVSSSHLRKFPILIHAHGWYKKQQYCFVSRYLVKSIADGVLAVSNPTKESLRSWGVPEDNIYTVYNTIDFDDILKGGLRKPLAPLPGIDKGYKILLPAGLLRTKGQHTAIKAAILLKQRGFDFTMWLAGDVSIGPKSQYSDYLEKLIVENELKENVFLLGWRADVRSLMSLANVIILPTHTEGLPNAVQEAMILKRPVITTPVGGIPDLIIDGETGLLGPVDDEKALADNIEKLMKDKDLASRIAERAHRHMYEKFGTDKHIGLVRKVFESAIERKRKVK